jgi:hypothetical protein
MGSNARKILTVKNSMGAVEWMIINPLVVPSICIKLIHCVGCLINLTPLLSAAVAGYRLFVFFSRRMPLLVRSDHSLRCNHRLLSSSRVYPFYRLNVGHAGRRVDPQLMETAASAESKPGWCVAPK